MEPIDYEQIKNNLKEIIYKALNAYKKRFGTKDICGFALCSDVNLMKFKMINIIKIKFINWLLKF